MSEPGPAILIHADLGCTAADFLAKVEASPDQVSYIGRGWAMPDAYAPDGLWLHVYATTRPSSLSAAIEALGSP